MAEMPIQPNDADAEVTADETLSEEEVSETPSAAEPVRSNASETRPPEKKKKKKRTPYVDDGHTVYDMSCLTDPREREAQKNRVGLTNRERWAVIQAAFMRFAPPMLLTILGFFAAMLLIRLWLHI